MQVHLLVPDILVACESVLGYGKLFHRKDLRKIKENSKKKFQHLVSSRGQDLKLRRFYGRIVNAIISFDSLHMKIHGDEKETIAAS